MRHRTLCFVFAGALASSSVALAGEHAGSTKATKSTASRSAVRHRFPLARFWLSARDRTTIRRLVRTVSAYQIRSLRVDLDEFVPLLEKTNARRIVRVETVVRETKDYSEGEVWYVALKKRRWVLVDKRERWSDEACLGGLKL